MSSFEILSILQKLRSTINILPLHFGWLLFLVLYKEDFYISLNVPPFDYTAFAASGEVGCPLTGLTTQLVGYSTSN